MSVLLIGFAVVGLVVWLASTGYVEDVLAAWRQTSREVRLYAQLHARSEEVDDAHRQARRAMNNAAQHDWRNPFE
ncbi:hypothetical protein FB554_2406 [Barrientosiimonas humi]|uniref:Uncharacterized protein n=1 Tax=Barrientosiimonas humi TaxID=999931 RepID=A0A542XEJ1_9MICO|nr:hypothetical protein [Barrientosiimonas humi]TQL34243.1 hypothetical protein FB554_2406 [Barrientosiimonas humi]CAG7574235.1 hypothetical protein BH39T_PBIAJDOK_02878 [Barrientosiimonas humi]